VIAAYLQSSRFEESERMDFEQEWPSEVRYIFDSGKGNRQPWLRLKGVNRT
jgi:hypothetical protein